MLLTLLILVCLTSHKRLEISTCSHVHSTSRGDHEVSDQDNTYPQDSPTRKEGEDGVEQVDGSQHVVSIETPVSSLFSLPSTCESNAKDLSFVLNTPEAADSGELYGSNAVFFSTTKQLFTDQQHH